MLISNFIKQYFPLFVGTIGVVILGCLGYRAIHWIIKKCHKTNKIDQLGRKNLNKQPLSHQNLKNRVNETKENKNILSFEAIVKQPQQNQPSLADLTSKEPATLPLQSEQQKTFNGAKKQQSSPPQKSQEQKENQVASLQHTPFRQEIQKETVISPQSFEKEKKQVSQETQGVTDKFINFFSHPIGKEEAQQMKIEIEKLNLDFQSYMKKVSEKMKSTGHVDLITMNHWKQNLILQAKNLKNEKIEHLARDHPFQYRSLISCFEQIQNNLNVIEKKEFEVKKQIHDDIQEFKTFQTKKKRDLVKLKEKFERELNSLSAALKNPSEKIESQKVLVNEQDNLMKELKILNDSKRDLIKKINDTLGMTSTKDNFFEMLDDHSNLVLDLKSSFEEDNQQKIEILRLISKNGVLLSQSLTESITNETNKFKESKKIEFPLKEFIKNEGEFKNNLEDLKTYKLELDALIQNSKELEEMEIKDLNLLDFNKMRDNLEKYILILNVINAFYEKIKDNNQLSHITLFACSYLETDFSPLLNIISIQKEFAEITKKSGIFQLCQKIKEKNTNKFKNPNLGIDSIASSAFQRVGRYPLTLQEIEKNIPKDNTHLMMLAGQCCLYAKGMASVVNNW